MLKRVRFSLPEAKHEANPGALHNLDGVECRHAVAPVVPTGTLANF